MAFDLTSKAVIVTGACGGIGAATARLAAEAGADLVLVDRDGDRLEALAGEVAASGQRQGTPLPLRCDVASEADMAAMAEKTLSRYGRIDVLVSCAGILRTSGQPRLISDTSIEEWRSVIDINLTGTFLANRAVLPAMTAQGEGDIVNLSSVSGRQGRAFDGPYSASKFGIIGLSESLAEEVHRQGIRVQTVLPDAVETELWGQSGSTAMKPQAMLSPDRLASLILTMVTLPRDTFLLNPVIKPIRTRTRRKKD